jgi:hypothetical protein
MSFTLPEAAKTTVAAIPPAIASVLTVFERQRTRQRGRQRLASISTVVYLSSYAAAGKSSILAGQTITSIPAGAGSTTGIPAPAPFPPAPAETTLGVLTGQIVVGTKSTKAAAGLTSALSLLIVADAGNSGTIWVSTSPNSPAGVGFPLPAGAGIVIGHVLMQKKLDVTKIYVIGTANTDKINIVVQY